MTTTRDTRGKSHDMGLQLDCSSTIFSLPFSQLHECDANMELSKACNNRGITANESSRSSTHTHSGRPINSPLLAGMIFCQTRYKIISNILTSLCGTVDCDILLSYCMCVSRRMSLFTTDITHFYTTAGQ